VRERGDGLRLAFESLLERRISREMRRKNLDRDLAVEPRVARLVDFSHPSRTERRKDLIRAETGAQEAQVSSF
jgi:hypothetical protein